MTAKKTTAKTDALEIEETPEAPAEETATAPEAPAEEAVTDEVAEESPEYVEDPGSDKEQRATQLSAAKLDKLKQSLRHRAERMVIDNHRDEYNKIAEDLFRKEGLEFTRRQTPEERAAARVKKVMAEQGLSREDLLALLQSEAD